MKSFYRPYTEDDYKAVVRMRLREADNNEFIAGLGLSGRAAIESCLSNSMFKWVVVHDSEIEGVFGVGEQSLTVGFPWFLGSDKLEEYAMPFLRQSKKIVKEMLRLYPVLMNYKDARHAKAIEWLEWLGFTFDESRYYTMMDPRIPFFKFHMIRQ